MKQHDPNVRKVAVVQGYATFRQLSCLFGTAVIHAKAVDTSICQCHLSCAVNGANQIVGDVVGKNIGKPVESVVKGIGVCKCNNNGVVLCMCPNKLSG